MHIRTVKLMISCSAMLLTAASEGKATAALPIDLEVAVVQNAPLGAMQEWGQVLSEMGLSNLRLRGANAGDRPSITPIGSGPTQRFRVVAVLNHRDKLIMPGGAFGQGDVAKLRQFFESLPLSEAEKGVERGIFGLTRAQFEQLYNDFSVVVTRSTNGMPPNAIFGFLTSGVSVPIDFNADVRAALARAKPLDAELKDLTTGTATAMILRSAGLALVPQQPPGQRFVLRVVRIAPNQLAWPVGWKPDKGPRQTAPAMYRTTSIEISQYTLGQALEALGPHMGVPLIVDEYSISRFNPDFAKTEVKFPNRKTYIRRAVDVVLSQGRVSGELRVDEAGRPFYWITKFGPDSPKALGADPATELSEQPSIGQR
jgi:hypothetical protein